MDVAARRSVRHRQQSASAHGARGAFSYQTGSRGFVCPVCGGLVTQAPHCAALSSEGSALVDAHDPPVSTAPAVRPWHCSCRETISSCFLFCFRKTATSE